GDGLLTLNGAATAPLAGGSYEWNVVAQRLPMQALVNAASHAKRDLPQDLMATGVLNAKVWVEKAAGRGAQRAWRGAGETSEFTLLSNAAGEQLELGSIPFRIAEQGGLRSKAKETKKRGAAMVAPRELRVELGPFPIELNGSQRGTVRGSLESSGSQIHV